MRGVRELPRPRRDVQVDDAQRFARRGVCHGNFARVVAPRLAREHGSEGQSNAEDPLGESRDTLNDAAHAEVI